MNNQEPNWVHDPIDPEPEEIKFSFDFHFEDGQSIWLPVEATVTMTGNSADIECSYYIKAHVSGLHSKYIDSQILEDQLRDHFSEVYTDFEIEFI